MIGIIRGYNLKLSRLGHCFRPLRWGSAELLSRIRVVLFLSV